MLQCYMYIVHDGSITSDNHRYNNVYGIHAKRLARCPQISEQKLITERWLKEYGQTPQVIIFFKVFELILTISPGGQRSKTVHQPISAPDLSLIRLHLFPRYPKTIVGRLGR